MEMEVLPYSEEFHFSLILSFLDQKLHIWHFAIEFEELQREYWKFKLEELAESLNAAMLKTVVTWLKFDRYKLFISESHEMNFCLPWTGGTFQIYRWEL